MFNVLPTSMDLPLWRMDRVGFWRWERDFIIIFGVFLQIEASTMSSGPANTAQYAAQFNKDNGIWYFPLYDNLV